MEFWHYEQAGQTIGPVPVDDLVRAYESGRIDRESLVWSDGMPEWAPLAQSPLAEITGGVRAISFDNLPYAPQSEVVNAVVTGQPLFSSQDLLKAKHHKPSELYQVEPNTNAIPALCIALIAIICAWPIPALGLFLGIISVVFSLLATFASKEIASIERMKGVEETSKAKEDISFLALVLSISACGLVFVKLLGG